MTRLALLVVPFLLLPPGRPAIAAPQCAQDSVAAASRLRLLRASNNGVDHTPENGACHVFFTQFVEAVTARKDAASCKDSVGRRRALEILDTEIQIFNDRIAEQSCEQ